MLQNNKSSLAQNPEFFMQIALEQAKKAAENGEVPIGAVIVDAATGDILSKTYNQTITHADPTAHAEILAIREACKIKNAQRIPECDLYVTLEPCPMCAAALSFARIRHVYFGAEDLKSGGFISGPALSTHPNLHHKPDYTGGILADEAAILLRDFFKARR
jgi:tRNA(Arg) A34 adenosine deaminase TadA